MGRYATVIGIAALLCFQPSASANDSSPIRARDALVQLQRQGVAIVFSTDVVAADLYLDVPKLSLRAVRRELRRAGLRLVRSGRLWLVTKAGAPARVSALRLTSLAGMTIESADLVVDGRSVDVHRNGDGLFECSIPVGRRVTVNAPGHVPVVTTVETSGQEVFLEALPQTETVIVTGSRHRLPQRSRTGSSTQLTIEEMSLVPSLAGDSFRVANRLPGMSSVGVSAKPRIRGGLQDEVLILVDGVELIEPFHLADYQNLFSAIDDRTVGTVDVYTGGFPARYGNRMSGVVDVSTARRIDKPGTELGLSTFSAFVNTRGESPSGNTSWLASARRGNLDLLTRRINSTTGNPRYVDGFGRVGQRLNENAQLFVGSLVSRDDVTLRDNDEKSESDVDSRYAWMRLELTHSPALKSATVVTYTLSNRDKNQTSPADSEDSVGFLDYTEHTRKYAWHSDFSFTGDGHRMEFGAQAEYAKSEYDSAALIDRGELGAVLGEAQIKTFDIHENPDGWAGGIYWSGEFVVGDALTVQPGLRWDFQNYYLHSELADQISPRLGLKYRVRDNLALRMEAGRFYQPEAIHEMQASDGVDHFFAPQRADHFIGAVEWLPTPMWRVRAEAYRKRYSHPKTRYENIFDPFVLLPELEADRVAISPNRAKAAGYDLETSRLFSDALSATLRYSYMDADDHINGKWVSRRWSQQHTVNAIASWQRPTFSISAALAWNSGWLTSEPPASLGPGETLPIERLLNNAELGNYFSFDVSASKTWQLGRSKITTYADVTNVFNRHNAAGIDYDVSETDAGGFEFAPDHETLLPVVVTAGVRVSF